jgi:hypothetical protein
LQEEEIRLEEEETQLKCINLLMLILSDPLIWESLVEYRLLQENA